VIAIELCHAHANTGRNCFFFSYPGLSSIRCVSLRSNNCSVSGWYPGLFWTTDPLTVEDSVIAENTGTYLTGESVVTFTRCHFDTFEYSADGGSAIPTVDCVTDGPLFAGLPAPCHLASSTFSRPTASFTPALRRMFGSARIERIGFLGLQLLLPWL
jgi:hypothetical protein